MGKAVCEEYEEWTVTPVSLPVRSPLYQVAPIGVGTPEVECLTSYIARLADAHCVFTGVLMDRLIVPLIPGYVCLEKRHHLFRQDGTLSNLLNATGPRALCAVEALVTLTRRADLQHLTLLSLAELVPVRGLIRAKKAWCPVCYEEWRMTGQTIYDPLLWVFVEVTMCARHTQRLSVQCPYPGCAKALPALGWRAQPGYCSFCQRWLGRQVGVAEKMPVPEASEVRWQHWVTHSLGTVFSRMPAVSAFPKRQRVSLIMTHAVQNISQGNVAALAQALGTSSRTVVHWCRGDRIPEIAMLLRLCYRLDISLDDFLFAEAETLRPQLKEAIPYALFTVRKPRAVNKQQIAQVLEQLAGSDEFPPPTLTEVGRRLGYEPTVLYKINRVACHGIADRYRIYRHQQREKQWQRYRKEIEQIALQLQAQCIPLTQRQIAPYLVQPNILLNPKIRSMLREVCQELEGNKENGLS